MRPRDVIVAFDDIAVAAVDDLHRLLSDDRVGKEAIVEVIRGAERVKLQLTPVRSKP
ncbi:MAG: PDZ domain-containing protein [Candidatus Binataceae bacterium]